MDRVGHSSGPLSDELLLDVLPQLDQVVDGLVEHLRSLDREVHLVLTSDHGMTDVHGKELLDRYISRDQVKKVINRGSTVGIWPHPDRYNRTYRRLEGLRSKHFSVYNLSTIPSSWHTGGPLFPPLLLVAKPGYLIHSEHWPIESNQYDPTQPYVGAHGYDATESDMHVPLFLFGPMVRPGVTYRDRPLDQTYTYKLLTALSGQRGASEQYTASVRSYAPLWSSHDLMTRDTFIVSVSLGMVFCALLCVLLLSVGLWKLCRSRLLFFSPKSISRSGDVDELNEHLISADGMRKVSEYPGSLVA
ncbi:unnamed protein product [Echinostoma caproni]|uniref:glycerophosphocholine cholinephosphodiesterase n=1 Tax=Echinostoma caproni TaxID=27848 RepID=A0A3P8L716_9TREM|nr:unnamed protein product [Echinostoma caproni]